MDTPSGVRPHASATARLPRLAAAIASEERKVHDAAVLAGKYRLGEVIGSGGMGSVHRATHVLLHRPVAVKLMHASDDPNLGERFLHEARVAAAARHPNVVDIIDFGTTDDGQPFMVMELLEGRTLRELYESGIELTLDEQIDVMVQVLKGLEAVHRAGIVHRDLKPANVFLTEQEDGTVRARLLDFGISFTVDTATVVDDDPNRRLIAGTPEYMSFEQCEGRTDIDERADVHAIGVMLYEMLSGGVLPFEGENPGAVLFQVMACQHTPLIELRPDLPELCALVERCMAPDREDRPQSARDLRKALLLAAGRSEGPDSQRSIPPSMRPVSSPDAEVVVLVDDDAPAPRKRRWLGWSLAAATAVTALVLAGFVTHVERIEDRLIAEGLTIPPVIGAMVAAPTELAVRADALTPEPTAAASLPVAIAAAPAALAPLGSAATEPRSRVAVAVTEAPPETPTASDEAASDAASDVAASDAANDEAANDNAANDEARERRRARRAADAELDELELAAAATEASDEASSAPEASATGGVELAQEEEDAPATAPSREDDAPAVAMFRELDF